MINKLTNTNKFLVLAVILIIFYLVFVVAIFNKMFFNNNSKNQDTQIIPTPTKTKAQTNLNNEPYHTNSMNALPQEADVISKERSIGNLLRTLPYNGKHFSLSYNYEDDSFTIHTYLNNSEETDAQIEAFLKANGVADKSWLQNLSIIYITPTPGL